MTKALALISGSLDSEVAATLVKQAGVEVVCAQFACPFQHRTGAAESAARIGGPQIKLEPDAGFLDVVRRPRFNFGGGPLSCLECRLRMLVAANRKRDELGADLIVTGEVLGQRATNQSRRQIDLITYHSAARDVILRPLSLGLLAMPAKANELGLQLASHSISGSGRRPIKALAKRLGIDDVDRPGPQCRLTDPGYMARLDDLIIHQAEIDVADIELLLLGRHYRLDRAAKVVVGRNAADNEAIAVWHSRNERGRLLVPANFQGPSVLLLGGTEAERVLAMSLSASRKSERPSAGFEFTEGGGIVVINAPLDVEALKPIQAV